MQNHLRTSSSGGVSGTSPVKGLIGRGGVPREVGGGALGTLGGGSALPCLRLTAPPEGEGGEWPVAPPTAPLGRGTLGCP